jgi:hypothetical protein
VDVEDTGNDQGRESETVCDPFDSLTGRTKGRGGDPLSTVVVHDGSDGLTHTQEKMSNHDK